MSHPSAVGPRRILMFGRSGQVATELCRLAPDGWALNALDRAACDLADPPAAARAIVAARPDLVINAAAWTAVDAAENAPEAAHAVNAAAPQAMAAACADLGIPILHVSTDYVFDGTAAAPHRPDAAPNPLGVYGASKLAGERAVRAAGAAHVILRTSWVFSAHGSNFVKTVLRLGAARARLTVVADQMGGPTPAAAIALALIRIAERMRDADAPQGIFHLAGAPDVSRAAFAREILAQAGLATRVDAVPTSAYPTPAPRPLNSRLDCTATEAAFGIPRPDWRAGLAAVLKELA